MKYYSDITKQFYESAKECQKAEKELDEKLAAEKAEKEKLATERKARAKEIEQAHQATLDAQKHERELINAFIKDYQSYHLTVSNVNDFVNDVFDSFFKIW